MKKSPIQIQFELAATNIMAEMNRVVNSFLNSPQQKLQAIQDAKAQMMALKEMYQGLLNEPIVDAPFHEVLGLELNYQ